LSAGCSSSESAEEYNKKLVEASGKTRSTSKVVSVETAVPGGTKIPCEQLLDVAKLTGHLGEKEPVTLSEHTLDETDATAVCSVRRGGKQISREEQEKRSKTTNKLGVLAGDELCNITAYCSMPADEDALKQKCRADGHESNESIGVYACVRVRPKGPVDAYTYRFLDPDSRCLLSVRGGPSTETEEEVQKCAKAALFLVSKDSLTGGGGGDDSDDEGSDDSDDEGSAE